MRSDHEAGTRWVGRSRIGRFGFWVSFRFAPVYGRLASAFVFSGAGTSCLGLSPLSGLTGATAAAAGTSGRRRMVRRVPPCRPAAALPRPNPLMGLASDVSRSGDGPGKQYQRSSSSPMCGVVASTVRSRETRRRHALCPLTSLQRVEATDALPILRRLLFRVAEDRLPV